MTNDSMKSTAVLEEELPAMEDSFPRSDEMPGPEKKGRNLLSRFTAHPAKAAIVLSILLAVLLGGSWFIYQAFQYESTDDAEVDGHIMPLSARISGQVFDVKVIEGQLVHAGDVLVVIDPKDYKVAEEQAQAQLADSRATAESLAFNVPITSASANSDLDSASVAVTNAGAGVLAAKQNLEAAKAALEQAEANAARSDADLKRYADLVAKEDVSRQQYDEALATAKANRAAVTGAQADVLAQEQVALEADGKLKQAQADLRSARTAPQQISMNTAKAQAASAVANERKAQLDQANLNLSYTIIRSPVTGIIGKKSVEVGQNVNVGQELVTVVPLDDIWVTANFKETQLAHMRAGDPVAIDIDAYGHKWTGHVTNLGGGTGSVFSLLPPENATGNYVKVVQRVPIRIDFNRPAGQQFNADGFLKPGLSVEPKVRVK
jgi:membrane fusion protein (multidrug efflux system)